MSGEYVLEGSWPDGKTRHGYTPQAQYPEPKDGRKAAPPPEEDEDD